MTDLVKCSVCGLYPFPKRDSVDGFRIVCAECGKATGFCKNINEAGRAWQDLNGVYENCDIIIPDHKSYRKRSKNV